MARGGPDYDAPDLSIAVQQGDISLMNVVQSGYVNMDGRGRIVWSDDLRNGLQRWNPQTSGTGLSPIHKFIDNFSYGYHGCIELDPNALNGLSALSQNLTIPFGNKMGFEAFIKFPAFSGKLFMYITAFRADGEGFQAKLYMYPTDGHFTIDDNGTEQTVYTPPSLTGFTGYWFNIKLTADFQNNQYYRLVIGGTEIDISGYTMLTSAGGLKGRVAFGMQAIGLSGLYIEPIYFGGGNISTDEP